MEKKEYSIQELSERTNIPRRTIHFYSQQNILPSPKGAGIGARYSEIHFMRLRLIPSLRKKGLRLDEIRNKFNSLDADQLYDLYIQFGEEEDKKEKPALPKQDCSYYSLPDGIILIVPSHQSKRTKERVNELLESVNEIFETS
ncbi:MAG: MerR family transcriptional regulator [Anaerolineaceae bacterium]|nr:MerR family transcriptional regulator [Anaerolineaceae bacterium]